MTQICGGVIDICTSNILLEASLQIYALCYYCNNDQEFSSKMPASTLAYCQTIISSAVNVEVILQQYFGITLSASADVTASVGSTVESGVNAVAGASAAVDVGAATAANIGLAA